MSKRSDVDAKQRAAAVLALLRREEPASQLSRRYGVSEPTLYRWRDEFVAGGESALARVAGKPDGTERRLVELERQLAQRDQVIGELTIANRILKKVEQGLL